MEMRSGSVQARLLPPNEENRLLTGEIYSIYVLEDFWNR